MALGLIPGGKLLAKFGGSGLGSFLGRIGSSAWGAAKHYAVKAAKFLFKWSPLGLAKRALEFMRRKPGVACGCFTASTLVWTSVGLIPIEQVQTGDWVLTRSEATNQYSWQEVTDKIVTEKTAPVELTLWHESGVVETIQTTDEHPFWVEGKGWTRADALQVGHAVVTGPSTSAMNGASRSRSTLGESRAILLSASFLSTRTTVYNLSVATNPNFFVGKDGVWVHNSSGCEWFDAVSGRVRGMVGDIEYDFWYDKMSNGDILIRELSLEGAAGVAAYKQMLEFAKVAAKDAGASRLVIRATRVSGGNPDRPIEQIIDLTRE